MSIKDSEEPQRAGWTAGPQENILVARCVLHIFEPSVVGGDPLFHPLATLMALLVALQPREDLNKGHMGSPGNSQVGAGDPLRENQGVDYSKEYRIKSYLLHRGLHTGFTWGSHGPMGQ